MRRVVLLIIEFNVNTRINITCKTMDSLKKIVQADTKAVSPVVDKNTLSGEIVELDKDVRSSFPESVFV